MRTIKVENAVYEALKARAASEDRTMNAVLRRLLGVASGATISTPGPEVYRREAVAEAARVEAAHSAVVSRESVKMVGGVRVRPQQSEAEKQAKLEELRAKMAQGVNVPR